MPAVIARIIWRQRYPAEDVLRVSDNTGGLGLTNLLFTSVGRRVELMRLFRASMQALDDGGRIIALDVDPLAPALHALGPDDRTYLMPRSDTTSFVSRLIEICTREEVQLVLPLIDPDIPILAREAVALRSAGAIAGSVDSRAAGITRDKWTTASFLRSLNMPVPATWLPTQGAEAESQVGFPLIVKPRSGSAAKDVVKVGTRTELDFFLQVVSDPIVQEYLPGPEITTDVVVDHRGNVLATVCRQRIAVRAGEVAKGKTIHNERIANAAAEIARGLGATGPITVQCIFKEGEPYFTEINARLGGGVPLAVAAGVDVPGLILRALRGETVRPIPWDGYRDELYMTRFDESFFLDQGHSRV
jgi:carbamoyl-phosphate synthase large subunit